VNWLKHAFALDAPGNAEPTEPERRAVDRVCAEVERRHLATPALLFLEVARPLNYLGSQVLHFFQPIVSAVLPTEGYRHFAEFLERRGSVDYLCERLEKMRDLPADTSQPSDEEGR
jgi:hypothetical protein